MQNLKKIQRELIYKTETDSLTYRIYLWLPGGRDRLDIWDRHLHSAVFKIDNQQGHIV